MLQAGDGSRGGDEGRGLVPQRRRRRKACSRADEHRAEQPPRHRRRKTRWFCHDLRMGWRARGWRSEGARPEELTGHAVSRSQQLPVGFSGLSGPDSSPLYIGTGRPASGAASQAASCLSSFATGIRSVHGNGNGSQNVVYFSPRVYGRGAVERQPRSPPWLMFERHHAKRWRNVVAGVRATGGGRRRGAPQHSIAAGTRRECRRGASSVSEITHRHSVHIHTSTSHTEAGPAPGRFKRATCPW